MFRRSAKTIALSAIVAGWVGSAQAAVLYTFEMTGPVVSQGSPFAPDGPVAGITAAGSFVLSDAIVGTAYRLQSAGGTAFQPAPNVVGLESISFRAGGAFPVTGTLPDFTTPRLLGAWTLSLTGLAGSAVPFGSISINNGESDARFVIDADTDRNGVSDVRGSFNTDRGGACSWTGACSFTGLLTAHLPDGGPNGIPTVPEPAGLMVLSMGLLGLTLARMRRR